MLILPGVAGLLQHKNNIKNNINLYRPKKCQCCSNAKLWFHGFRYRKPDRSGGSGSLNPVPIPRFICTKCKKTVSVLPECIAPLRWFMWKKQQEVILLSLSGMKIRTIAKQVIPSRSTISRWMLWVQDRFRKHKDAICNYFHNFGLTNNYEDFWNACFRYISLSKAMYLCYASGVNVP